MEHYYIHIQILFIVLFLNIKQQWRRMQTTEHKMGQSKGCSQSFQLHRFIKGKKQIVDIGQVRVYRNNDKIILSMKFFSQIIDQPLLIHQFTDSKSYVFKGNKSQIYSLSFRKANNLSQNIQIQNEFESKLRQQNLLNNINEDDSLNQLIQKNYPDLKKQQLYQEVKVKGGFWNSTKRFLKNAGQSIGNGLNKAFQYYNEKIGQKNQQRWSKVKEKGESWNKNNDVLWDPIAKQSQYLGQKASKSDNVAIKLIKNTSSKTQSFLNDATNKFTKSEVKKSQTDLQQIKSQTVQNGKAVVDENEIKSNAT